MTGFDSKRDMAADKLQEPVCDKDPQGCWNVRCQLGKQCKNLAQPAPGYCKNCKDYTIEEPLYAQPAQEPANYLRAVLNAYGPDAGISLDQKSWSKLHAVINEALAQPAQEPVAVWELQEDGWDTICDGDWLKTLPVGTKLYTTPPKRQPLTDDEINKCDMCGYVGKDKDSIGQCPKCRWDELRPLVEKARQKPLTDDQIYDMYNEPRSDAEMLEFARAIEAALGIKE